MDCAQEDKWRPLGPPNQDRQNTNGKGWEYTVRVYIERGGGLSGYRTVVLIPTSAYIGPTVATEVVEGGMGGVADMNTTCEFLSARSASTRIHVEN